MSLLRTSVCVAGLLCGPVIAQPQVPPEPTVDIDPAPPRTDPIALWISRTESGNVLRTAESEPGSYDTVGALFDLLRSGRRIEMGLSGSVEYREYADEVAEPERRGNLLAFANTIWWPERLSWIFSEKYTQTRIDAEEADRPGNREGVRIFSTGPELTVPFGRNAFNLGSKYDDRRYDETTYLDSESIDSRIGLSRRIRPNTVVGIWADRTTIEYDEAFATRYIDSAELSYSRTLSDGSASLVVGTNKARVDQFEVTGPLFRLDWNRKLTPRSTVTLSASRGFTEAGRLLWESLQRGEIDFTDVLLSADVTDRRELAAVYTLTLPRTTIGVDAALSEDEFVQDVTQNSDQQLYGVTVRYDLTMRMNLGGDLRRRQRHFDSTGLDVGETAVRLLFRAQLLPTLELEASVQSDEGTEGDEFSEESYHLRLTYWPGRRS